MLAVKMFIFSLQTAAEETGGVAAYSAAVCRLLSAV
jgi:hypothetical protein